MNEGLECHQGVVAGQPKFTELDEPRLRAKGLGAGCITRFLLL